MELAIRKPQRAAIRKPRGLRFENPESCRFENPQSRGFEIPESWGFENPECWRCANPESCDAQTQRAGDSNPKSLLPGLWLNEGKDEQETELGCEACGAICRTADCSPLRRFVQRLRWPRNEILKTRWHAIFRGVIILLRYEKVWFQTCLEMCMYNKISQNLSSFLQFHYAKFRGSLHCI